MSAQSGISASPQLLKTVKDLGQNALIVKVSADSTTLVPHEILDASNATLPATFAKVHSLLKNLYPDPAYIIIPVDDDQYIFITFISDSAPIRLKMLYASTKNELMSVLGSNMFPKSLTFSWSELDEVSYDHYQYETGAAKPQASSDTILQKTIDTLESISLASSSNTKLPSMETSTPNAKLLFLIDPKVQSLIDNFGSDDNSLIILYVNTSTETLELAFSGNHIAHTDLISTLALNSSTGPAPRYALYNYAPQEYAFVYACPSGSKVKDRMMLAASKGGLISHLNQSLSPLKVDFSVEVGDYEELDQSQFQPNKQQVVKSTNVLKFSKPKGPRRKGLNRNV